MFNQRLLIVCVAPCVAVGWTGNHLYVFLRLLLWCFCWWSFVGCCIVTLAAGCGFAECVAVAFLLLDFLLLLFVLLRAFAVGSARMLWA